MKLSERIWRTLETQILLVFQNTLRLFKEEKISKKLSLKMGKKATHTHICDYWCKFKNQILTIDFICPIQDDEEDKQKHEKYWHS